MKDDKSTRNQKRTPKNQILILINDPEYEEREIATERGRISLGDLPVFIQDGLEIFFTLMAEKGWKKLELSTLSTELSFADNQRTKLGEITDRSAVKKAIRYIRSIECYRAKREVIKHLSSEISRTEYEIAGLNRRIEELHLKVEHFENMLAGVIQEVAVLSADFEVVESQPPQHHRDRASLQIPRGRHYRRKKPADKRTSHF